MNRGVDRGAVFFADADRVEFGRRLADLHDRFGIETLAYCLMDNHYHLLLRLPEGGLSAAMQHLSSVYTRHTNDRVGRDGPLFRGRFRSIHVPNDEYLLWVTRYIHRNALDLPGVSRVEQYRWSSFRTYVGLRRRPAFMNLSPVLGCFDGDINRFASFTERHEGGELLAASTFWATELQSVVALAIATDELAHSTGDGSLPWLERTVLVLLSELSIDAALRDAASALLEPPSPTARRMAVSRARRRRTSEPAVDRVLRLVHDLISGHSRAA